MQLSVIQRILGLLLMTFSLTMLPPIGVGWLMGDPELLPFWEGFGLIFTSGLLLWLPVRRVRVICGCVKDFWWWCCSGWCWGIRCCSLYPVR
ncbi:MAG: hypothetical protein R3E95_20840 [Thiolinea sp.]